MTEEKILTRVQKLLDKANADGTTEAERQAFLDKADELMIKHTIDAAMLNASLTKNERRKPVKEHFSAADANAPHWEKFRTVLRHIAYLHRCRVVFHYSGDCTLFGFHEDVEYVKMKWLNVYLHFSKSINPHWDTKLSVGANAYNFHRAGTAWTDVEGVCLNAGVKYNVKQLRSAYRAHCAAIGEEPKRMTQSNFYYKEAFAEAFKVRMCARIMDLMAARDDQTANAGALVAVKDLGLEVDELFYETYPNFRPLTAAQRAELERLEQEHETARLAALERMTPEERREYDREQERIQREQAKDNNQYWRNQERVQNRMNRSGGVSSGRASADQVDLSRNEGVSNAGRKEL
jgi:hypothetical protein